MPVITVSREKGSGGRSIARNLAEALGYHFVEKDTMERVLNEYGLVDFKDEYDSLPSLWDRFFERGKLRDTIMDMLRRGTLALARHGNVVMLGRGCYGMLREYNDVLNVRIQAPFATRVDRVMAAEQIPTRDKAESHVRQTDELRASFVKSCYGLRLNDTNLFDVVIDTGKLSPDMATGWLIEAARSLPERSGEGIRGTDSIEPDPILLRVITDELGCEVDHH
jgi:cytidylate kinase